MPGQESDNKILASDREGMPALGGDEFTDRPPHMKNLVESQAAEQEKEGLYETGM
jgi:hypothetical protein